MAEKEDQKQQSQEEELEPQTPEQTKAYLAALKDHTDPKKAIRAAREKELAKKAAKPAVKPASKVTAKPVVKKTIKVVPKKPTQKRTPTPTTKKAPVSKPAAKKVPAPPKKAAVVEVAPKVSVAEAPEASVAETEQASVEQKEEAPVEQPAPAKASAAQVKQEAAPTNIKVVEQKSETQKDIKVNETKEQKTEVKTQEDQDAAKFLKKTESLLHEKIVSAKKIDSIDDASKQFQQTTLQLSQENGLTQIKEKTFNDIQAFIEKTQELAKLDDNDITPIKTEGDPQCVNGPCSQGGTWPNYQRYDSHIKPPAVSLIQLQTDQNVKSKQNLKTKSKFIDGYDETNMEYDDETEKKGQET